MCALESAAQLLRCVTARTYRAVSTLRVHDAVDEENMAALSRGYRLARDEWVG